MRISKSTQKAISLSGMINLSGLVAGVYQGYFDAKGIDSSQNYEFMRNYLSTIAGGALGFVIPPMLKNDNFNSSLEEIGIDYNAVPKEMTPEEAKNTTFGCLIAAGPFIGAGVAYGFAYAGYAIGRHIANKY